MEVSFFPQIPDDWKQQIIELAKIYPTSNHPAADFNCGNVKRTWKGVWRKNLDFTEIEYMLKLFI
jgi:hypothetical protein